MPNDVHNIMDFKYGDAERAPGAVKNGSSRDYLLNKAAGRARVLAYRTRGALGLPRGASRPALASESAPTSLASFRSSEIRTSSATNVRLHRMRNTSQNCGPSVC